MSREKSKLDRLGLSHLKDDPDALKEALEAKIEERRKEVEAWQEEAAQIQERRKKEAEQVSE